ncbi:PREDICTED: C-C motif chemokine 25 [Condylura cristata]|uniref:C-C motif chemokine 25 n=1 Tax=Condylura cristata TaxID=143302 RepID=UPI0003343381|nr:PREDICTED: C-C motif chemokine 25 [Condylura cristata]
MRLWLLTCLAACFLGAWTPAVHAQDFFEDCCLAYQPHAKESLKKFVLEYHRQAVSGSCNLPAVIFFFRNKKSMVCGDPETKWVKDWIKFLDKRDSIRLQSCLGSPEVTAALQFRPEQHRELTSPFRQESVQVRIWVLPPSSIRLRDEGS